MTDFRLKTFCCVAQYLSYTKASHELCITQPAVSKHIQELEHQYKVRLFERLGNRIKLTPAGEVLLAQSLEILAEYSKLDFEMNLLRGEHSGSLNIGASSTISQYVLPPILAKFVSKFPEVHVNLLNGNSEFVESELMSHHIDLGLVEGNRRLPNLKYTHLMDDELVAIAASQSRYYKLEEMSLPEFCKVPLILRENGSGTLSVLESALGNEGIKIASINVMMQLGSSESIKLFLRNADVMSVLSFRCVSKELSEGIFRVVELPDLPMNREFDFVQLKGEDSGLSSLFMDFADHILKI